MNDATRLSIGTRLSLAASRAGQNEIIKPMLAAEKAKQKARRKTFAEADRISALSKRMFQLRLSHRHVGAAASTETV